MVISNNSNGLSVALISASEVVFKGESSHVVIPSTSGEVGILPFHAPYLTSLEPGIVSVLANNEWKDFYILGGFCEVSSDNSLKVLAEQIYTSFPEEAIQSKIKAYETLYESSPVEQRHDIEVSLTVLKRVADKKHR